MYYYTEACRSQSKSSQARSAAASIADAAATIAAAVIFFLTEMVVPMANCRRRRERECIKRECISTSQMNAANNEEALFSPNIFLQCPSHRIFEHMYRALNVVKKIIYYTV